jgi:signal transduction histidine kinase
VKCALKVRRLDAELQEHFQLLKQQRDDLLRLQLEKARLTAFIVHDLKNPLNSIDLNAQLLLTDRDLTPLARDCGAHIRVEAKQLNRMILNLLDLAKSDEGRMHPFPLDLSLRAMVDEIVAEMEVPAKVRHVTLHSSIDTARAFADESLLRRTLANLVENAIRHAPPESVVDITAQRAAHSTELRVIDAGPGVPREMRDRVFDAFTQVDRNSGHSERSSRGLGLTFCKVAMEAHGGRIWVEDSAIGATFCVSLPDGG